MCLTVFRAPAVVQAQCVEQQGPTALKVITHAALPSPPSSLTVPAMTAAHTTKHSALHKAGAAAEGQLSHTAGKSPVQHAICREEHAFV